MEERTEKKLKAAGQIAYGVYLQGAGVSMMLGHGLLATGMKLINPRMSTHQIGRALTPLARHELKEGAEQFKRGLEEWKKA